MSVVIVSLFLTGAHFMLSSLARAALDEEPGPCKPAASRSRFHFAAPLVVDGAWPVGGTVGEKRQTEEQHARPTEEDRARNDALANLRLVDDAPRI